MGTARRAVVAIALLGLGACTYGPEQLYVRIENHMFSPNATRVAFMVHAERLRPPTGLTAWPDGGKALVLAEAAAIYECDTVTVQVRRLWRGDRPQAIRSEFAPWLGPWTPEGLYFSLRGSSTETTTVGAPFIRTDSLIRPDGRIDPGPPEPPRGPATSEPQRCAAAALAAALAAARADPPTR